MFPYTLRGEMGTDFKEHQPPLHPSETIHIRLLFQILQEKNSCAATVLAPLEGGRWRKSKKGERYPTPRVETPTRMRWQ